jgi:two-component system, LytTR family, response regulator
MSDRKFRIRVLIVDDEPLGREGIRLQLAKDPVFEVIGESANGESALRDIAELGPDLLFLDVQMPRVNGFELLRKIPDGRLPMVVFITAFDQYAVPAFEVHALDYLLKPLNATRFKETLERIKTSFRERRQLATTQRLSLLLEELQLAGKQAGTPQYPDRLAIRTTENIYFVPVADIDWIEATDYYATLHTGKQTHLIRESLNSLEARLEPTRFLRIHRSTIVCVDRIKSLKRQEEGGYDVILHDGTRLKLSRSYRAVLQSLLGKE